MAMTGGTSYCVLDKTSVDGKNRVRLYIYVKEKSQNTTKLQTTLQLGMYVNSTYGIGSWNDVGGSYIGTATSGANCKTFNGDISYGSGTRWLVENQEVTVTHSANGTATPKIYWKWGVNAYTSYIVGYQKPSGSKQVTLTSIRTSCTAPTSVTASSDNFESSVTIEWSGASSGIGNAINAYLIRYRTSADNKTWGNWGDLTTVSSTSSSGSYTKNDMDSLVSRGYYVQFAIKTQTSNSSYHSGWAYSNVIRRKPYTACGEPTTFTVTPNNFESNVTLSWDGASGGTNNAISSYLIQYATSVNNSTWGNWIDLQTVSTTKTSHSLEIDVSAKVSRGSYIKFQIRTQGSAGSSYYSGYKTSGSVRRNPYTVCTAPTTVTLSSNAVLGNESYSNIFESKIDFVWSGATAGENNPITGYFVQYRISNNGSTWGTWVDYTTQTTTATTHTVTAYTIADKVNRGQYVQFRIKTLGTVDGYDSDYIVTSKMRKNSIPSAISSISVTPSTLEYSYGDSITIGWQKPTDINNNIYKYKVEMYQNIYDTFTKIFEKEVVGADNLTFAFDKNNAYYPTIANNQQIKFVITPIDSFNLSGDSTESPIIIRYDLTGVSIGVDGKWVNCQIFVGTNGQWIEQEVFAGIDSSWVSADDAI